MNMTPCLVPRLPRPFGKDPLRLPGASSCPHHRAARPGRSRAARDPACDEDPCEGSCALESGPCTPSLGSCPAWAQGPVACAVCEEPLYLGPGGGSLCLECLILRHDALPLPVPGMVRRHAATKTAGQKETRDEARASRAS